VMRKVSGSVPNDSDGDHAIITPEHVSHLNGAPLPIPG
jgi:hypothetical protein